jgi:UDP-3-O-[3-hydroxymyristoyl] glucosamine N-acyltransferase
MEYTVQNVADYLQGEVEGDGSRVLRGFGKIEEAREGELTFLSNPAYTKYIYTTGASAVLVNRDFVPDKPVSAALIRVDNAYEALARLMKLVEGEKSMPAGIHSLAFVDEGVTLGKEVYIGPYAVVEKGAVLADGVRIFPHVFIGEGVKIGEGTVIHPGVKIYHGCVIGRKCVIHASTVIGADGFGFAPTGEEYEKIPQIGIVEIEDDVEIGANVTIDRATIGRTLIRKGVKIDNLIQIGHNVEVGERTVMAAQTGIAGSSKIGKDCMFGGQVGISGHLRVADGVKIAAKSGVHNSIKKENAILEGIPVMPIRDFQRSAVYFKRLPDLVKRIDELEKKIREING